MNMNNIHNTTHNTEIKSNNNIINTKINNTNPATINKTGIKQSKTN
jgi:hypothetical protein